MSRAKHRKRAKPNQPKKSKRWDELEHHPDCTHGYLGWWCVRNCPQQIALRKERG